MFFSIPYTQEHVDDDRNTFTGYYIHINKMFHCIVRYRQLHNLHMQLCKNLDIALPEFPPKKLFPLTISQQEERRLALEKYIQTVGQNLGKKDSEILNGFLLKAQQETFKIPTENKSLDIFFMDGSKITLSVSPRDYSGQVLKALYKHIKLPEKYHSHFALFISENNHCDQFKLLRILQDFESPYQTYKNLCCNRMTIVLRKSYWDIMYDIELLDDPVALHLLYVQTVADVRTNWMQPTEKLPDCLESLQKSGNQKEYLNVVRTLKYYGYIQFATCFCDYPERSIVLPAIGKNELNLRIVSALENEEVVFKVSRIRCWRITTAEKEMELNDYCYCNKCDMELSFEYLVANNDLQWITITTDQAPLMSVCLQAMIDELMQKCVVGSKSESVPEKSWTYVMRDSHSRVTMGPSLRECSTDNDRSTKSGPIIKKLTDKLSAIKLMKSDNSPTRFIQGTTYASDLHIMENNAFRMIEDDDL